MSPGADEASILAEVNTKLARQGSAEVSGDEATLLQQLIAVERRAAPLPPIRRSRGTVSMAASGSTADGPAAARGAFGCEPTHGWRRPGVAFWAGGMDGRERGTAWHAPSPTLPPRGPRSPRRRLPAGAAPRRPPPQLPTLTSPPAAPPRRGSILASALLQRRGDGKGDGGAPAAADPV